MRKPLIVLAVLCLLPAWASEPGEPLDCSDWVFLEPGLSCSTLIPYPCDLDGPGGSPYSEACLILVRHLSNTSTMILTRGVVLGPACGVQSGLERRRHEIYTLDDIGTETLLAHVDERCNGTTSTDLINSLAISFDPIRGALLVGVFNSSAANPAENETYVAAPQRIIITGLTTLFEVIQTFEPTPGPISFRVPHMPEGFQFADHFDTFWGDILTVGDWSQAQPLQCGYPAAAPTVGDHLTVADTLPELKPGQGRYFVTAVTHQGETRYGRKSSGGLLTGRDPALLPGCGSSP